MNNLWIVLCLNHGQTNYSEQLFVTLHLAQRRTDDTLLVFRELDP